uniref:Major facilitator superfamily (MFS) profile domain-containing protein n=1 Tax=Plectus sambesii TaxID=2011161 RepID=A0A914WZV4_9BILA
MNAVHPVRSQRPTSFEDILVLINPLGRWQAWTYFLLAFHMVFYTCTNLAIIFMQITPDHACCLPISNSWTIDQMKAIGSPLKSINGKPEYDACHTYNFSLAIGENATFEEAYEYSQLHRNTSTVIACTSWVFNTSVNIENTLATQYDLVCQKALYVEHAQLIYMAGFMIGSLTAGILSDKYGRKTTAIGAAVLGSIAGVTLGLSPNFAIFCIIRFLLGFSNVAVMVTTMCLALEMTTSKWRVWIGGLFFTPYALGYTILPLFAYLIRDWRFMHMAVAAPTLVSIAYWWLISESPRWLLVNQRVTEAEQIIRKAAKVNRRQLPAELHLSDIAQVMREEEEGTKTGSRANILTVFKIENRRMLHPRLAARAVNIFFNWFVSALVYYGVLLNVSSFAGDVFVNNAIAGAVEFPACLLCVPLLSWSRKKGLAITLLLTGVCLFIVPLFNENTNWLKLFFAMAGKLCISASFSLLNVYTTELFPTVIRNSGLAVSSCIASAGSMLAPYVSSIGKTDAAIGWTPMLIFGVLSIVAGLLTLLLPETLRKKLPDTLEHAVVYKDEHIVLPEKYIRAEIEKPPRSLH